MRARGLLGGDSSIESFEKSISHFVMSKNGCIPVAVDCNTNDSDIAKIVPNIQFGDENVSRAPQELALALAPAPAAASPHVV